MAGKVSQLELNSDTVFSLLNTKLAGISKQIDESADAGRNWDEDLDDDETGFIHRLVNLLSWQLQEGDDEAFLTRSMLHEEDSIRRLGKHKHECGQRMTSSPVIVENV
jgi:hypothetical protein